MGLRLAMYGLAFNLLHFLSRMTLGLSILKHHRGGMGIVVVMVAPMALLAIAARLLPDHRVRLVAISMVSVAISALIVG